MRHKIALIPGDGIGKEVVPAAARVTRAGRSLQRQVRQRL